MELSDYYQGLLSEEIWGGGGGWGGAYSEQYSIFKG